MVSEFGEESNPKNKDICYQTCNMSLISTCMFQKWCGETKLCIGTDRANRVDLDQTPQTVGFGVGERMTRGGDGWWGAKRLGENDWGGEEGAGGGVGETSYGRWAERLGGGNGLGRKDSDSPGNSITCIPIGSVKVQFVRFTSDCFRSIVMLFWLEDNYRYINGTAKSYTKYSIKCTW